MDLVNINQRVLALRNRALAGAAKDVTDGYYPSSVEVCKECGSILPCGPFEQILVAAWALSESMDDPVGCPEENLDEVAAMMGRLCDIYENYEEKEN
jgi:hypothetical protein